VAFSRRPLFGGAAPEIAWSRLCGDGCGPFGSSPQRTLVRRGGTVQAGRLGLPTAHLRAARTSGRPAVHRQLKQTLQNETPRGIKRC
jgi:hypothetical protein